MTEYDDTSVAKVNNFLKDLRQGCVFSRAKGCKEVFSFFSDSVEQVVIVSQTCDVVLAKRPSITFAAVKQIYGGEALLAKNRDNPRYIYISSSVRRE